MTGPDSINAFIVANVSEPEQPVGGLQAALSAVVYAAQAAPQHPHTMGLIAAVLGLSAIAGFYWLGWWYLARSLYQNVEDHEPAVQALWSLVFSGSCNMLLLILFDLVNFLPEG